MGLAMNLEHIRAEIERMHQISRQLKDIQSLQHAGLSTLPAEALLARMQATVDNLCAERDKRVGEQRMKYPGTSKVIKDPQIRQR
jgi:C4-dicarboxylate-specific signal transduction histidine kinase